jgi:hypothetical protein
MALWKLFMLPPGLGLLLSVGAPGRTARAQAPALAPTTLAPTTRAPTTLDRLRVSDSSGKVKEIDLDRAKIKIADAPPLAAATERPAIKTAAASSRTGSPADSPAVTAALRTEINQRVRDVESCRGSATSGQIQLRWRVQPDGRTSNTLVLEQQPTDMDIMKCARKRMEAWRFTPPTAAPVDVETSYSFVRPTPRLADDVAPVPVDADRATRAEKKASEAHATEGKGRETKDRDNDGKLNEARLDEGK